MPSNETQSRQPAYEALKAMGHSAAKAAEIVLDASRGDIWAKRWIDLAQTTDLKVGQ